MRLLKLPYPNGEQFPFWALLLSIFCFELGDESALRVNLLSGFSLFGLHGGQRRFDGLHLLFSALAFYDHTLQAAPE